jgi:phosphatidylglycerophosphatase A
LLLGTAGALLGAFLAALLARLPGGWRLAATGALLLLAIPICEHSARDRPVSDDPRIVADELLTFPVATATLPVRNNPALLAGVFVTSRVLDGLKPPPAGRAEELAGGLGIVLDDVVANAWTLLLWLLGRRLGRWRSS